MIVSAMAQLLGRDDRMQLGLFDPIFVSDNSKWFQYDGIDVGKYSPLEYMPYVNARARLLGKQRQILNNAFKRAIQNSTNVYYIDHKDKLSGLYHLL